MDNLHFGPLFNICCRLFLKGPQFFHTFCQTDFSPSCRLQCSTALFSGSRRIVLCTSQCSTATPFDLFSEGPNSNKKLTRFKQSWFAPLYLKFIVTVYSFHQTSPFTVFLTPIAFWRPTQKKSRLRMLFNLVALYTAKRHQYVYKPRIRTIHTHHTHIC